MKDPNDYNVRSIDRALQILDCFDDDHPTWGLTEISQEVGLHKATTHRIMTTLLNFKYLEKTNDGQKYRLGLRLASLGFSVVRRMDLRSEALPHMRQIVDQFDEACDLSIFDRWEVFYVEVVQSNHALTIAAAPGMRLPAYCTASGKVFLAFLPEDVFNRTIQRPMTKLTPNTITDPLILKIQLEEIRKQGYGVDSEEMEVGIKAISAPIFNQDNKITAAIRIPAPTSRIPESKIPELAEALIITSKKISRSLGWHL